MRGGGNGRRTGREADWASAMERVYRKQRSERLGREMELLVFGQGGQPVVVFPTSGGRFYEFEDQGMVEAVRDRVEAGRTQLWCVDRSTGRAGTTAR